MNLECPWEAGIKFLNKLLREDLIEKMESEQRDEGFEGINYMAFGRKSIPGRELRVQRL